MNDFSKLTKKIKSFLSGRSKTDFLIVFFLGILLMIVAVPTGQNTEKKKADSPAEQPEEAMGQGKTGMDALDYKRELEKQLDERFYRAGRSLIVNLTRVSRVTRETIRLLDGTCLPLPRGAYEGVNRAIIQLR